MGSDRIRFLGSNLKGTQDRQFIFRHNFVAASSAVTHLVDLNSALAPASLY
jgi:hypothetical protein